jgi:SAM-dependent methyltransferase
MRCPMHALELPDGSVDHLVSLAGLHHEPDLPTIFREMRRVLRHGATAVIADVQAGTSTDRFLNGFVADHNPMGHDGVFLNDRTAPALEASGLRIIQDEVHRIQWRFSARAEMGAFLRLLFGVTNATPADTADAAETILGVKDRGGDGIDLAWPLRRIVCQAA